MPDLSWSLADHSWYWIPPGNAEGCRKRQQCFVQMKRSCCSTVCRSLEYQEWIIRIDWRNWGSCHGQSYSLDWLVPCQFLAEALCEYWHSNWIFRSLDYMSSSWRSSTKHRRSVMQLRWPQGLPSLYISWSRQLIFVILDMGFFQPLLQPWEAHQVHRYTLTFPKSPFCPTYVAIQWSWSVIHTLWS